VQSRGGVTVGNVLIRVVETFAKKAAGRIMRSVEPIFRARLRDELAVVAIFREEAPFLDEWLSFHHGVGATHFYLYNNFSTDAFREVLAPWIAGGLVTLIDWPVAVGQRSAYRDALRRTRRAARWVAFIDIDEFLFSPVSLDIRPVLRRYGDLPGVEVWQVFFGSAGHEKRPDLSVTEAYTRAAGAERTTVKTIANPRLVRKPDVHQFKYWGGEALDTARRPVTEDHRPVFDMLRINHYWSRSLEDLATKVRRGDASTPHARRSDWHFAFEQKLNGEVDETILPFARAIRAGRAAPAGQPSSRLPSGS
jgi:hypothetical protein